MGDWKEGIGKRKDEGRTGWGWAVSGSGLLRAAGGNRLSLAVPGLPPTVTVCHKASPDCGKSIRRQRRLGEAADVGIEEETFDRGFRRGRRPAPHTGGVVERSEAGDERRTWCPAVMVCVEQSPRRTSLRSIDDKFDAGSGRLTTVRDTGRQNLGCQWKTIGQFRRGCHRAAFAVSRSEERVMTRLMKIRDHARPAANHEPALIRWGEGGKNIPIGTTKNDKMQNPLHHNHFSRERHRALVHSIAARWRGCLVNSLPRVARPNCWRARRTSTSAVRQCRRPGCSSVWWSSVCRGKDYPDLEDSGHGGGERRVATPRHNRPGGLQSHVGDGQRLGRDRVARIFGVIANLNDPSKSMAVSFEQASHHRLNPNNRWRVCDEAKFMRA